MKLLLSFTLLFLAVAAQALAQPLYQPFDFVMPTYDSSHSAWLPQIPAEEAGAHGFVRVSQSGHLEFTDGTPARFAGVTVYGLACFPDSIGALATAGHLQKLGVNLVRFVYFDYHNANSYSTLAPGNRSDTLSVSQMKRLDWFIHQLKLHGIYVHFVLKSRNGPRKDDGVWGWDSTYNYGNYIAQFNEQFQGMQQRYLRVFLQHVNPYTGLTYATDPAVALLTLNEQTTLFSTWVSNRLNTVANSMSYTHSRLLDTMFTNYLRKKYKSTAALKAAYYEGSATTGPNLLANPGFENLYEPWTLTVNEGAKAAMVLLQGPETAPGDGPTSLRIVIQQVNGVESRIYLQQYTFPLKQNGIYRIRFRAKTDASAGRSIRFFIQGGSPATNAGINETVNLTTAWTSYEYTFRSTVTDSLGSYLRFYLGREMGDVFLDGFALQTTGREGLDAAESLEAFNIERALFADIPKISLPRALDQTAFYDSLSRAYAHTMLTYMKGLGVRVPIAVTNATVGAADTWTQQESDFTSETAQWDYNGTRPGEPRYTDSTWVIRNYSILTYRDQKVPEFSRNAIAGKPFVAELYGHAYPNVHRSEMMIFYPAYASLHDWDGAYLYHYNDRQTDLVDRRQMTKDDFWGIMADPSITALLPQFSAIMRNRWIAPAQRTIMIEHDTDDLRRFPFYYSSRGSHHVDGSFANVVNMVSEVRIDSFNASRHYTASDYYFTVPSDDNIQSDTKQITLDMTKGVMSVNTPYAQGASGALATMSSVRTDDMSISWIDGGAHLTALWTSLDTAMLKTARRSLLTVTTRAANTGAAWQFGDSSFGKNWGSAPVQMEGVKVGVNFFLAADTLKVYPLDTLAQPDGSTLLATRQSNGSWRVSLDLSQLKTPWFGIEQVFAGDPTSSVAVQSSGAVRAVSVGDLYPNPVHNEAFLPLTLPEAGAKITLRIVDALGRTIATSTEQDAVAGSSVLPIDVRNLPAGTYTCIIDIAGQINVRRIVVQR